jgi:hypothetical protein
MERRGFLKLLVGGVAAAAAIRTFPFRVYSFPSDIVVAPPFLLDELSPTALDTLNELTYKYIIPQMANQLFTPSPAFERLARLKGWDS